MGAEGSSRGGSGDGVCGRGGALEGVGPVPRTLGTVVEEVVGVPVEPELETHPENHFHPTGEPN